jgi:hypothetical protein
LTSGIWFLIIGPPVADPSSFDGIRTAPGRAATAVDKEPARHDIRTTSATTPTIL